MSNTIRGGAALYGGAVALLTILIALPLGILAALDSSQFVVAATVLASLLTLGVGGGAGLAAAGWRSIARLPARVLHLPAAWILALLFLGTLAAGELFLRIGLQALLPALHVVASLLPPLILIAAVAGHLQRRGVALSWRDFVGQFAYGAIGATALAIALESAAMGAAFGLGLLGAALLPGGQQTLHALAEALRSPAMLMAPEELLSLVNVLPLALGLGLLVAVVTPMLEELVKSLGVPLAAALRPVTRPQAFLFGLMAGAGFSLTEALFYGMAGLPHAWAGPVLTRAGTVVIHGAASGLMGLAWYEALTGRSARFALYTAAAIGLHGLWNGLGGLLALASLSLVGGPDALGGALATGLAALAVALLGATWLAALGVIVWQTRQVARQGAR